MPRREAWYGAKPYSFNGGTFPAAPLPPSVLALRIRAECVLAGQAYFDGCLANFYRDGSDSVSWHSDDEPDMRDPVIASVSLGAPRDFLLRRKNPTPKMASAMLPNSLKVSLGHGSLLVMGRGVQAEWQHSLPKRKSVSEPRVNLTYRTMKPA